MEHDQIARDLQSPSIQLLRSQNAPLILSFLYEQFKHEPRPTVPESLFVEALDLYLENFSDSYSGSARDYLKQWSDEDHRWLRVYRPGSSDDFVVELTTHTERILGWIQELQARTILGTESRFYQIIDLLSEIATRSVEDVDVRLAQLEREKQAIQHEIDSIKTTGKVERYTPTQIRERFQLVTEGANQLLRDFATVEERFRDIARVVQQSQLQPDARKGTVVGTVLDAEVELRESEVGRSFYSFWDYLQDSERKDELNDLLDQVHRLPELGDMVRRATILRSIVRYLIDAGLKVDRSNHRLAEQLRRMLDDVALAESRRARRLIAEIKQLCIFVTSDTIDDQAFTSLETLPNAQLVMERDLWEPQEITRFVNLPVETTDESVDGLDLRELISPFYVDMPRLRQNIDTALEQVEELSLLDLLQIYPAQKGLPEVMSYLTIASEDHRHSIDQDYAEVVEIPSALTSDLNLAIALPHVIYRRKVHEH